MGADRVFADDSRTEAEMLILKFFWEHELAAELDGFRVIAAPIGT